jgi:hypothetical protein
MSRAISFLLTQMGAIILLHPKILNRVIIFTTWYFVVGLLIFHKMADFAIIGWQNTYYFWDKSLDLLFFLIIYAIAPKAKSVFVPVIYYSIVRLCFQIITITVGTDTNDQRIVNILYLMLLVIFICQSIKEIRNE